ncbi:hypothetical protein [Echinicola salinicaeni]|uniref:hypothetical protein n=1 Tax=Echinicola salinicaeni TaxID=2762757 RepID=UPI001647EEFB|nr:hypothetical protein [Echinicola salinicaeni]
MKYLIILFLIFTSACQQSGQKKAAPEAKAIERELVKEKPDTLINQQAQNLLDSTTLQHDTRLYNEIQSDTIEFIDYNDDFDYWYLIGRKKGKNLSFVYNWEWTENEEYNFRPGDLIVIQWKKDSIHMAGDEEVVKVVERVLKAKKIGSGNLPIQFLTREDRYDESVKAIVSTIVINQSYLHNISPVERAALGYIAFDIGNECEWGYNSDGTKVLYCQIVTALDLDYQCSDTQLNFLRKWFSKDSIAIDKLKSCPSIPNSATFQSTFEEILIEKDESNKTITVQSKITGINIRESKSWEWTQTDRFEYSEDFIVLVDSQKSDLTEVELDINPDKDVDSEIQGITLALKDFLIKEWGSVNKAMPQNISYENNILVLKSNNGFQLSSYDFNDLTLDKDPNSGVINITVMNVGGGGGGNVVVEENYIATMLQKTKYHIIKGKTKLIK